ncbi:MAG: AAA family ATPase [Polyangiaceae bacterium]|nr:AAA family ATPase [Polyangiaceae bacterium]
MRISRLAFKGVGPFEDATFDLPEPEGPGELVLFEGPTGSGKTTVVETIAVVASELAVGVPGSTGLRLHQRLLHDSSQIDVSVSHDGEELGYSRSRATSGFHHEAVRIVLRRTLLGSAGAGWAAFAFRGHQETASLATDGPRQIPDQVLLGALSFGREGSAAAHLGQLVTNLENQRLKALIYAGEKPDAGRRQELEQVATSRKEALRRFEQVFSDVLGRRVTIGFSVDKQAPHVHFDGEEIPLDFLGEGMRGTFAWLSDLLVRIESTTWRDQLRSPLDQDFWLILDEIDESLHPTMQARILPALRRLLPNARIYATTHSPFVVASVGEGTVFSIRPGADHRVRGPVEARRLRPGQSLELVASEIFDAPSEFVDEDTRAKLEAHERDVKALQRQAEINWETFALRRRELMGRNDEVRTAVSMQELPVRQTVQRALREREPGV